MEKEEKRKGKKDYHGSDNKFKKGNPGGPGGERVGAGRPPKPEGSLLRKLYDILEKSSEQAIKILQTQFKSSDAKVAQGAAKIILSKVLPERSANESWGVKNHVAPETMSTLQEMLELKRQRDVEEDKKKWKEIEEEKTLKLIKNEAS